MRITALEVDGFGVWSGLKLGEMAGGLNVFFGPNEAGKTTLMQFIRSVLYGFSPPQRDTCLAAGRPPGGSLAVLASHGQFLVSRFDNPADPQAGILSLVGATAAGKASNCSTRCLPALTRRSSTTSSRSACGSFRSWPRSATCMRPRCCTA